MRHSGQQKGCSSMQYIQVFGDTYKFTQVTTAQQQNPVFDIDTTGKAVYPHY